MPPLGGNEVPDLVTDTSDSSDESEGELAGSVDPFVQHFAALVSGSGGSSGQRARGAAVALMGRN